MEAKELHELARKVCEVLPGFEYVDDGRQRDLDGNLWGHAHLTSLAGAERIPAEHAIALMRGDTIWWERPLQIYFSNSRDVRNKVRVSLDMPHVKLEGRDVWLGDSLPYSARTPACVHVSGTRKPAAVAREIERRLLPEARAQWSRALTWLADREAYQVEQDGVREQLRDMGVELSPSEPARGWLLRNGDNVGVRVQGRSVVFERLSVDAAQACAILQALRG